MGNFITRHKRPILGGLATTVFVGLGVFSLGNISGYEAMSLLEASMSGLNMLCNTIILAATTILALLLTLLGISSSADNNLKKDHYHQVLSIAKFDVILIVGALVMFQFFNIPIIESEGVPTSWFDIIYWTTLIISSILCGMMIIVVLMLYTTVTNIIAIVGLKSDHSLLDKQTDSSENAKTNEEHRSTSKKDD